jgi:hypothetical protein
MARTTGFQSVNRSSILRSATKSKKGTMEKLIGVVVGAIAFMIILGFIFGFIVTWLWNSLLPGLFGFPYINIWEGWGLVLLTGLLFRSSNTVNTK